MGECVNLPAPEGEELKAYGPEDLARDLGVGPEALADLEAFRVRLAAANEVMNLVGPSTLKDFWRRHVLDSAQLLKLAPNAESGAQTGAATWADLGAGAGFPGVVLAILLKRTPGANILLVDSLAKRCRFLSEVVQALELPAEVICARAEDIERKVEVVTARACAPMPRLLGYARPWLARGAVGLFLKGENVESELQEARKSWTFTAELLPSISDPKGRIVRLRRLSRAR
jgi:16S rRNA (guanine527-N7)-methyltransferase